FFIFKCGMHHGLAIAAPVGVKENHYGLACFFVETVYLFKRELIELSKRAQRQAKKTDPINCF
ncbi:MAG: hypothetical protein ACPGED_05770, partial [Flavobacteriales bacterium]